MISYDIQLLKRRYGRLVEGCKHFSNLPSLNERVQQNMLIQLENATRNFIVPRGFRDYDEVVEVMTRTDDAAIFVTTQFPMMLKAHAEMISREIVSEQPMDQSVKNVFYYDVKRDDGTSTADGIHVNRNYSNNVEYNPDSPQAIKTIELSVTEATVSATEKKLKAVWTTEAEQDFNSYHNLSVDADLGNALYTTVASEWDRTILEALLQGATGGSATFDQTTPGGISYADRKHWMETLFERCIDVDTQIFKKTYKKTNWIVVNADVGGFLEKLDGFVADSVDLTQKIISSGGRYFAGTLKKRWRIYVDPFFPANKMLMGFNNPADWKDTCFVWAPYIPVYFSDVFLNPDTFVKTRSILSRNGYFYARPDLCGVVTLTGS
jgi:hypothetical protein